MSSSIDERIVEMQFNNRQFEEGVKETTQTLEEFKKQLNLEGAAKGFNEIENASKNVKLGGISAAVDEINKKFSLMGVAAATAVQNMTNRMVNAFTGMVNSVTVAPITGGFSKYEEKLKSTQVILNAITDETKKNMEYVGSQLDRIATFTDETSYSFTDMVSNIGKFTASNVDLEVAVTAMQGISTWAARAGASVTEAGRAMYNLSQSIGMGYVATMDWKSIENANMATAEFKRIALEAAVEMKQLTKVGEDMYETLDGKESVTVENFRNTLQQKWFTSEVLLKALDEYGRFADLLMRRIEQFDGAFTASQMVDWLEAYEKGSLQIQDVVDETGLSLKDVNELFQELGDESLKFSRDAFKAAYEARTFSDAIAATVDAVSTKWMAVFELLFGNYEQAKRLWTDLSINLWDIFAGPVDELRISLKKWAEAGGQAEFLRGIYALGKGVYNIIMNVREAFSSIFPAATTGRLVEITKKFADFAEKFRDATEYVAEFSELFKEKVTEACEVVFGPLEEVQEAVEGTTESLDEMAQAVIDGLYGNGIDRRKALEAMGLSYEAIQNKVNELLGSSYRYLDAEGNVISDSKLLTKVHDKLAGSFEDVSDSADNAAEDVKALATEEKDTAESTERLQTIGQNLHDTLVGIFSIFRILSEAFGALNRHIIIPLVRTIIPAIISGVTAITGYIGRLLLNFAVMVHNGKIFDTIFGTIGDTFKKIVEGVKEFIEKIKELDSVKRIVEKFKELFEFLGNVKINAFEGFNKLIGNIKKLRSDVKIVDLLVRGFDALATAFDNLLVYISPFTSVIGAGISKFFEGFSQLDFSALTPVFAAFGKAAEGVTGGLKIVFDYVKDNAWDIKELLRNTFSPELLTKWKANIKSIPWVGSWKGLMSIVNTLLDDFSDSFERAKSKMTGFEKIFAPFSKVGESLSKIFEPLSKWVAPVTKNIGTFFTTLINGLRNLNINEILNYIQSGVIIAAIGSIALMLLNFSKILKGITWMFESIAGVFNAIKWKVLSSITLTLATSFAIFAASLYFLAKVPAEQLKLVTNVLIGFAIAMVLIIGVLGAVTKSLGSKGIATAAGSLVAIAGTFLIIAGVLILLKDFKWADMIEPLEILGTVIATMVGVALLLSWGMKSLTGNPWGFIAQMAGLLIFATSVKKIVEALADLANIPLEDLEGKMGYLIGIIGGLALVGIVASKTTFGGSFWLLSIVAGLILFIKMLKVLQNENFTLLYRTLGKLSGIIIAVVLMSRLAGGSKVAGLGTMFFGLGIALLAAVVAIRLLAKLDEKAIDRGVKAILALLLGMALIIKAASKFSGKGVWQLAPVFIALSFSLLLITACIYLLSLIDPEGMWRGLVAIEALLVTIGGLTWVLKGAEKVMGPLIAIIILVGVVAAALWALSLMDQKALRSTAESIGLILLALTISLSLVSMAASTMNFASITLTLIWMAGLLASIGYIFSVIVKELSVYDISQLQAITLSLIEMIGTLTAVTFVAQFINPGAAAAGAAGIAAFVGIIEAVALILGALNKINGFKDIVVSGLDMLVTIGTKIGELVGGFFGGMIGGVSGGFPTVAENLSAFAEAIVPFIEFAGSLTDDVGAKISMLKEMLTGLMDIDFGKLTTSLTDADLLKGAMTNLATMISELMNGLSGVEDWDIIKKAVDVIGILGTVSFNYNTNWGKLGKGLPEFGSQLASFATNISELSSDSLSATRIAAQMTTILAELKLPNDGGALGWLVGDNNWSTFGKGLVDYGKALMGFSEAVAGLTPEYQGYIQTAVGISENLTELLNAMPNSGGKIAELLGDNTWVTLGQGLVQYGLTLLRFGNAVQYLGQYEQAIETSVRVSEKLTELEGKIPNSGGGLAKLVGDNNWNTFKEGLSEYGETLKSFAGSVSELNATDIDPAIAMSTKIAEFAATQPDGAVLSTFGAHLGQFGKCIADFITSVSSTGGSVLDISSMISGFAQGVSEITGQLTLVGEEFTGSLILAITNSYEEFAELGRESARQFNSGIKTEGEKSSNATGKQVAGNAYDGVNSRTSDWYSVGTACVQGFINGLGSKMTEVSNAGKSIADKAYEAAMRSLDARSPSRRMKKAGSYGGEGFVLGLLAWVDRAATAADMLASSATDELHDSIASTLELINEEMDTNPVITPVLDLSNVTAGARQLNGLINNSRVNAGISSDDSNQNGTVLGNGMTFVQNNYSPKALSRIEIYRQTRNQFAMAKGLVDA